MQETKPPPFKPPPFDVLEPDRVRAIPHVYDPLDHAGSDTPPGTPERRFRLCEPGSNDLRALWLISRGRGGHLATTSNFGVYLRKLEVTGLILADRRYGYVLTALGVQTILSAEAHDPLLEKEWNREVREYCLRNNLPPTFRLEPVPRVSP